ncbi:MAG: hypothetical protein WC205_19565 [Opitutaceae bacterium]|jgi:hypothetical protein
MRSVFLLLLPLVVFAEDSAPSSIPVAPTSESSPVDGFASTQASVVTTGRILSPAQALVRRAAALESLRSGHDDDAESKLEALSSSRADNPGRHLSLAVDLLRAAFDARAVGDPAAAERAARLSLKHLALAETDLAKQPRRLATIQSLRGTLTAEFLGTEEQAGAFYRKAVELDATNTGAQEKLDRSARSAATEEASIPETQVLDASGTQKTSDAR